MRALPLLCAAALPLFCCRPAAAEPQAGFPAPRRAPFEDRGSVARIAAYRADQARLEATRAALAARLKSAAGPRARAAVEAEAREALERGLVTLSGPWLGTPWDFYGVSEEPGRGKIACGYFVTTLLRDAGLRLERVKLAQQASEYIVKTVSPAPRVWRFRTGSVDAVLETVRAQPERWFVVGLDLHVGLLLRLDGGEVRFCHASYLEPVAAVCEDAATAAAMQSRYHVVGALFTPELVRRWLAGEKVPSVLPAKGRAG